jgi:hypothetical protein
MFGVDGLLNVVMMLASLEEADPMDSLGFSPVPEFGRSVAIYENAVKGRPAFARRLGASAS